MAINRHGLMRLGALNRISELQTELDELRAILRAPAQPIAASYRTTKVGATETRRATSTDAEPRQKRHWMQRPENAAKRARMQRKAWKTRRKNNA